MIRGITFDKQLLKSGDHAHEVNHFYQGSMGVTKGCAVSENVDGNLVVADGYFMVYGRLTANEGDEVVTVPSVASGTLYSILVYEIDLTKENTIETFSQGVFKIVSDSVTYPTLTRENLDDSGNVYQMEFARFENAVSGIANLTDTRTILDMTRYTEQADFDSHLAESAGKHITESGNNSNGRYIKYDDGTMICYKRINNSIPATIRDLGNVLFPATFYIDPTVNVSKGEQDSQGWLGTVHLGIVSTTTVRIVLKDVSSASTYTCHMTAIGRWK